MAQIDPRNEDEKKVEDEPLKTVTYRASTFGHQQQRTEKVLFGASLHDRRRRIISGSDDRLIMHCVGRIASYYYDETQGTSCYYGTGTIFKYDFERSLCYVITCAHNVVATDAENAVNDRSKMIRPYKLEFERINTYGTNAVPTYSIVEKNDILLDMSIYHPNYEIMSKSEKNDLAILAFRDYKGSYKKLFEKYGIYSNQANTIKLFSCDNSKVEMNLTYELYGYPFKGENEMYSNVNNGGMYGMKAKSNNSIMVNNTKTKMFVRLNNENSMYYYNGIDTEGGQSGSSLFIELKNESYGIVGIHTGGDKNQLKNWSVALNHDKIEWINKAMKNLKGSKGTIICDITTKLFV